MCPVTGGRRSVVLVVDDRAGRLAGGGDDGQP
jgi:hypothetical protein